MKLTVMLACALSIGASINGLAQESRATLGGKVTDSQAATVNNATVLVTAVSTGVAQHVATNRSGDWRIQGLVPGVYRMEVSASGFKTAETTGIELQVADQKFIDTRLQVGERVETVTVEATAPLIDTTAAVSGTVITTKELEDLPSTSHSPASLLALVPGATVGGSIGGSVHLWSNISNSNVSVNGAGSSTRANNFQLDGGNDTNAAGQIAFVPPMDSVAEFRVVENAYDAAIGRQAGSTMNISSKTGTGGFHGVLYEYNQNNFLNARRYENKAPSKASPVHVNEYGGNVGGPVWIPYLFDGRKKKTFFFFTYDGIRNRQPANTGTMTLPTMLERQGDFSQSFTSTTANGVTTKYPILIYDPATINTTTGNRQLISPLISGQGSIIPASRINPITAAFLNLIPAPDAVPSGSDSNSNNYTKKESQDDKFKSYSLRVDQSWNNANHSYVNLRWNNWNEISYDPFGANNVLQGSLQHRLNRGMTLDHMVVVSPRFLLDVRYNVTGYYGSQSNPSAGINPTTLGFSSGFAALQQLPSLPLVQGIVSGAENSGLGTSGASTYTNDTFQTFTGSITQTAGNHTLRYGAEYMIQQEGAGNLGASGGTFGFGNNFTTQNPNASAGTGVGSNVGSFLLGLPTYGSIPNNANAFWSQHFAGLYLQDDWRATPRLTVNVGLRWDYERPISERFNRYASRFDPNLVQQAATTPSQAAYASLVAGPSSDPGVQLLQAFRPNASTFVVRGGTLFAGVNGTSPYVVNPKYRYFQPRLGFAYRVHNDTVVRGGLGRFVQATFSTAGQPGYSTSTPFVATTDNYYTAASSLANPFPTGIIAPTGNANGTATNIGQTGSFTDPNIGRPYSDEASLYLQQEVKSFLIEIGGTFNITHGLTVYDPLQNSNGTSYNLPSTAAWRAAFTPSFDATGRPVDTLPGNVQVANPFKGVNVITNGTQNNSTVSAYSLLRPNPLLGDFPITYGNGKSIYYSMNTKVERRFSKGFSILQSFSWSKKISENTFIGPQVVAPTIERRLDTGDQKFHYVLTPLYELPFGRGKMFGGRSGRLLDEVIGGWEITGIYQFQSGTPLTMPTNSSFFKGSDPARGVKSRTHWFDTSSFVPYPTRSTTVAQLAAYPSWTGVQSLPGGNYVPTSSSDATKNGVYQDFATRVTYNQTTFGDIRNPFVTDLALGARKSFRFSESIRLQLRIDAFNALNHALFGNIDTNPSDTYFGAFNGSLNISQINAPRSIELGGKLFF